MFSYLFPIKLIIMFVAEMNIDIIILVQANEKEAEDHKKTTEEKVSEQKSQDSEKVWLSGLRLFLQILG